MKKLKLKIKRITTKDLTRVMCVILVVLMIVPLFSNALMALIGG